jgi:hypothetical protein
LGLTVNVQKDGVSAALVTPVPLACSAGPALCNCWMRRCVDQDKPAFADHWTKDLDQYFPEGIDTPGIVMIPVSAKAIRYWDGSDESPLAV